MAENIEKFIDLRWPDDKDRIRKVQEYLNRKKKIRALRKTPKFVAGVDAAFFGDKIIAVACLYKYPELVFIEVKHAVREVTFPYIPGLLSFREGPAVIEAVKGLGTRPDLILFDGQGIAHPRGLGIASYTGVLLDIPSVGCAKTRLVGSYKEPGLRRGSWSPLEHQGRVVGAVVRTQDNLKPLFVSPGHRIDIEGSIKIVLGCTGRYRLTEPVRRADMLSKELKRRYTGKGA